MATTKPCDKKEKASFSYAKGQNNVFPSMFHNFYEIYFLINGEVEFICGSIRKNLKPFDIVVIPAGEYHQFISKSHDYERCVLNVEPDLLSDKILKEAFGNKRILRLNENHRIMKHLLYLKELSQTENDDDFKTIVEAVATDIVFLIKKTEDSAIFEEIGLQRLSVEVMKYINAHYRENINLNKLADVFFVSVSTICHYFKEDFGVSIKQYILEKQMNEANYLISNGHRTQEVSALLGFENYSTFFRAYKKRFGFSPKEGK